MNHTIDEVTVADTICRLRYQLKILQILLFASVLSRQNGICAEVVLLQHQRTELMVVEVEFNLLIERGFATRGKHTATENLLCNIPWL